MATTSQRLKERIAGVVVGLPTLFNPDFSINHAGIRRHVDFLIESGVNVLMISRGVSELPYLSSEEILAVTATVARQAAGRVPVISSTFEWWTGQAAEFVARMQDTGADGCLVVLPPYFINYNPAWHDDAICRHFEAIARASSLPLLIHERSIMGHEGASGAWGVDLVDRLAALDQVVGMKLEGGDRFYAQAVVRKTRDRLAIIGDWGPEAWLFSQAFGVNANIGGMGPYAPRLEVQVWEHQRAGRLAEARQLINEVMTPFWAVWNRKMDWVAAMKACMDCVGLAGGPMRPPAAQLTEEQRRQLKQGLIELGIIQ
jgi:dihydrodipicolinate synthase/N-acetylneuraminate lyase